MTFHNLINGYRHFQKDFFLDKENKLYTELTEEGQSPDTLIIACSDSRIEPAILTHSKPGDFFAIRNIAALVPPYQTPDTLHGISSAIEYAVQFLEVRHIIVLGHSQCGGVGALLSPPEAQSFEFLSGWLSIADKAREQLLNESDQLTRKEKTRALEQAVILTSLNNLLSFPWIKEKHEKKTLQLHGWYFDMTNEELFEYEESNKCFEPLLRDNAGSAITLSPEIKAFVKNYVACQCDG